MFRRVLKFLASLQLAVVIIASLAILISVGTFVESRYDAWTAKNWVYNSVWMYLTMGALVVSLVSVIVDRWPWKARHTPFILAHVGIIIILYGSLLTQLYGIDGTLRLPRSGESVKEITLQDTQLVVFRSRSGDDYEKVFVEDVNFLKSPLSADKPFLIKAKDLHFEILESINYGQAQTKVEASSQEQNGAALRYQLSNANVSEVDWLIQRNLFERAAKQVGPVLISMGGLWDRTPEIHEIRLYHDRGPELQYALYTKNQLKPSQVGTLTEGMAIKTSWMGLELKALRYFPKAQQKYEVTAVDFPTPTTRPALKVRYNEQESFLVLNDYIKVFTNEWVYLVAYVNKRVPLGFELSLAQFKKSDYPGTLRAMSYESEVHFDGTHRALISMNEPLKHKGFYMYQASFEESNGLASASILSVNQDPGRSWKYAGSLIMSLGILLLFYWKPQAYKKRKGDLPLEDVARPPSCR